MSNTPKCCKNCDAILDCANSSCRCHTEQKEINQCDGCQRGLPIVDGNHKGPGKYSWSGCTKDRYEQKEKCQHGQDWVNGCRLGCFNDKKNWNKDEFSRQCPVCKVNERVPSFNACAQCHHDGITKIQIASSSAPEASWEEILRDKVNYDPAEIGCEWDLDDIISFIRSTLATQEKRLRAEIANEIENMEAKGECSDAFLRGYKCFKQDLLFLVDAAKIVKGEK